ncbi:DUF86 domain-containing protein [Lederbergia citrea]|uniref:DUF86 domain-containing protein n=1 Tax=Lederbergia citrea TaxID=2833581 RepID=A0A942Z4Z0_9BACI|nr:DUF86 domain-containing protein [Lederbergia citrea]MBS4178554.1 DUF86 domain-containing protein [Lederbergia citrea]MBS4205242.1 DUF86 domain-containing protein [Lederbergia citrea]MBS4222897.1 DUF86 domain-containing protein [Lederbergia citrea]
MYFVDREKIESLLKFMEQQLLLIEKSESWETAIEKLALERSAHTIIESVLDTGNAMIDGFIMRDPGSYEDIVDILTDEKVVSEELSAVLKDIIMFRKMLVQQYVDIDHRALLEVFIRNVDVLQQFSPSVRTYLTNELGPVSAFKN